MARKIKQSPKLPAETRKQQLLDSARKLFIKKGYRMTTTDQIARDAGLTKGAVYFHFKSKEDIFFDLIRSISDKHGDKMQESLGNVKSPKDFFRLLMEDHCCADKKEFWGGVEYWEIVDLWVQAVRIPRIKRFMNKRLGEGLEQFVDIIAPYYRFDKKKLMDWGLFIFVFHNGLATAEMFHSDLVDKDKQIKMFENMLDSVFDESRKKKPSKKKK